MRSIRLSRSFLWLVIAISLAQNAQAQLTGTKTVPGDYPSLASAITALNAQGVGTGGVTINLLAGNPQTSPNGGYVIGGSGSPLLTTTSASNQVSIQGNGNTITAPTTLSSGVLTDALFKIIGADWITLTGFTLMENAANNTTNAGTNNMIEWGIAILYVTATNGAQNNTITNNTIDLNRTYQNTFGIYSNSTHTASAPTVVASATTANGGNHQLKIYSNTITDVNQGILVVGPMAAEDFNLNTDIGGTSGSTANTLTNFGTTGTFSAYANVSGTVFGMLVRNSIGYNISWNSITSSNGGTTSDTLRGIVIPEFSLKAVGTFINNINHNTISLITGVAAAPLQGIAVEDSSGTINSTIHIDYNNFLNCGFTAGSPSGTTNFIRNVGTFLVTTVSHNTFTNLTINSSGSVTLIYTGYTIPEGGSQTVHNNSIITAFNKTIAGGNVICLSSVGNTTAADATITHTNNNFSNITLVGNTGLRGLDNGDGLSSTMTTRNITDNILNNWIAGGPLVIGISHGFVGGATSISRNIITNISSQDTLRGISILAGGNTANPLTIDSNLIGNLSSVNSNVTGIRSTNKSVLANISNNTIHTLSTNGTSGKVSGISTNTAVQMNIYKNIIYGLSVSGASPSLYGISIGFQKATSIYKNKIYDLQKNGSGGVVPVMGINVSGDTTTVIHNNLIGKLTAPAFSLNDAIRGINISSSATTSTRNVYYNTVYLNASSSGTNFGTTGIYHVGSATPGTGTLDLRNNVIINSSTPKGTGKTVAYRRSNTNLNNYNTSSNNNLLYAGTPGATRLIFSDGTNDDQTIAAFRSRVSPRESASVTENVSFISTTGSSPDFLHVNSTIETQVESGGAPIGGYTVDYDSQNRNASTPDMGGDEGTFMAADLTSPLISYTLIPGTSCTADRMLSVTITDASGVNTSPGTKPRLYFKKSTQANTFVDNTSATNGWKYVEATNSNSQFTFTTNYSLLFGGTGVSSGDSLSYFVVAQDLALSINVGINSGTFNAQPPSVALAAGHFPLTGTINGYKIMLPGLTGTITVGASGMYTSLTSAGGLFSDLNTKGMSGDVLVEINSTSVNETGVVTLNQITYTDCTGGPYTLTIKPTVVTTLTGNSAGAIIRLNGSDNIIIDGSIGNTTNVVCPPATASRDLTIVNTNTGTTSAVVWIQSNGTNGATGNTIMNCNITGNSNTTTLFGIGSGGTTIGTTSLGTGNHDNAFINNNISKTQHGIYSQGASTTNKNTGTIINQNLIHAQSPDNVQLTGIRVGFEEDIIISGNHIAHLNGSATTAGISLGLLPVNTFTAFTGNEVTGALVSKNIIDDIVRNGNGTSLGISISAVSSASSSANVIANNMIAGVHSTGAIPDNFAAGILIGGGAQGSTNVYYNSVSMTGSCSGSGPGFGIAIGGSNPVVDVRNNIFVNKIDSESGTMYAIGLAYNTYSNLTSNHNNFFTPQAPVAMIGGLGNTPAGDLEDLASWQSATGKDAQSVTTNPGFISASDLHIDPEDPANVPLDDGAQTISITDDIDCEARATDIGADEFVLIVCTIVNGGAAVINGPAAFCGSGIPAVTASGYSAGTGTIYQWMSYASAGAPLSTGDPVDGQNNPASLSTGLLTSTAHYRLRVICTTGPDTSYSNLVSIIIYPNAIASITGPSVLCENEPAITLMESGGNGATWNWSTSENTQSILVDPETTTTYSVTVTTADGCSMSGSKRVIVKPAPEAPVVLPDLAQDICTGAGQELSAFSNAGFVSIIDEDFAGTIAGDTTSGNLPAGWSGTSLTAGNRQWGVVASAQGGSDLGTGHFLYCESDAYADFQTRAQVITPVFDGSAFASLTVRFRHYYDDIVSGAGSDSARVYISNDGGANYTLIQAYDSSQGTSFSEEGAVTANIPAGITLTSTMRVKLVYNSDLNGNDWFWAIDDFVVEGTPHMLYSWVADPVAGAGLPANANTPLTSNASIVANPTLAGTFIYTATANAAGCSSESSSTAEVSVHSAIVTNTSDASEGSLRDIIACAPPGAVITFDAGLLGQTISLSSGEILIDKNLTLLGLGMLNLTISGSHLSRIFHIAPSANVMIVGMSLENGNEAVQGGALLIKGTTILENVRLKNNFEDGAPKALTMVNGASLEVRGIVDVKL